MFSNIVAIVAGIVTILWMIANDKKINTSTGVMMLAIVVAAIWYII